MWYLVAPEIGSSGVLALSSLNGANGFKLDGENNGDYSGISVSAAGDINGDGLIDLLIGAPRTYDWEVPNPNNVGHGYVVFGKPEIVKDGLLSLSDLNGENGFKLDGEILQMRMGFRPAQQEISMVMG